MKHFLKDINVPASPLVSGLLESYNLTTTYYQVTLKRKKSGFHVSLRRERLETATAVWKINESSAPFLLAPT